MGFFFICAHSTNTFWIHRQVHHRNFDSGIGGLTVAHAIQELLPNESMVYFGDTAHLPYGDKSEAAIQAYSIKIADVLLMKGCKVIVIACNSSQFSSYELLKEYVRSVKIINVIDQWLTSYWTEYAGRAVGLIGTNEPYSQAFISVRFRGSARTDYCAFIGYSTACPYDWGRIFWQ